MLSLNIAPVLGGIVINQVTWRRIGEINSRYPAELQAITRRIAQEFDNTLPATNNSAIQSMRNTGLIVNTPTPAQVQLWQDELDRAMPSLLVNNVFDRDLYNRIVRILATVRGR